MPTRDFTIAELARLGVPPDSPEDIEYSETVLADEPLGVSKYSQTRRCIFRTDDGRTWAVEYEAKVDAGDYEVGPPPDNYGWWGDTITGLEVVQVPVTVMHWRPVSAFVFNSRSVNRSTKHAHDGNGRTLCPSRFMATAPIPADLAASLPLCGGCARALGAADGGA
jgi:hypothetical protein